MSSQPLDRYLAEDEELLLSFRAVKVTQGNEDETDQSFSEKVNDRSSDSNYTFGATDRRIVYLEDSGGFKDIDYQHISSIETDVEEEEDTDPRIGIACCGGLLLLAGLGGLSDDPQTAIISLLIGVGLIAGAVHMDYEEEKTEKQKMKFITGDEAHQQLEVTLSSDADANIGAELSRILREQR